MNWRQHLRHAFAVEKPGIAQPNDLQKAVVERLCAEIVRRHLATPAIVFLEMSKPLNYLGSQAMQFFAPLVTSVMDGQGYRVLAEFLEQRGSIAYICQRLDQLHNQPTPSSSGPNQENPDENPQNPATGDT
jgi:hypothetical protein